MSDEGKVKAVSKHKVPETNEDMVKWEPLIKKIGMRKGVPSHELDDFYQNVLVDWIAGDYLAKYDPEKASFTTYLWSFISKRAMRDRDRGYRDTKHLYDSEISDEVDEDSSGSFSIAPADERDYYLEQEESQLLRTILEELKHKSPVIEIVKHVYTSQGGVVRETRIDRSLYTLALLLLQGYHQREIAIIYKRSVGTVSGMVAELRRHPVIVQSIIDIHPSTNVLSHM